MNEQDITQRRDALIREHGEWTAHNFLLRAGVYTYQQGHKHFARQLEGHGLHLQRVVQIVADCCAKPWTELRVLDLGCLEGLYAVEFARLGAEVVGLEGRAANIAKAQFAKEVIGLPRLSFEQADVRSLSAARYGQFDVVLVLGILYHLDWPDVPMFIERVAESCTRLAIVDTHISLAPVAQRAYQAVNYAGRVYREHAPRATQAERLKNAWASLDNSESFWLTRPSLYRLLARSGFTSVYHTVVPALPGQGLDRDTLVALKGTHVEVASTPGVPAADWTEQQQPAVTHGFLDRLRQRLGW